MKNVNGTLTGGLGAGAGNFSGKWVRLVVMCIVAMLGLSFAGTDVGFGQIGKGGSEGGSGAGGVLGGRGIDPVAAAKAAGAGRFSENVAIVPIEGPIDRTMAFSVLRRIKEAEAGKADAIVVQLNCPGGEVGAVLDIASALKRTSVGRTVAWVNPQAYSGGAIVALACQEILVSDASSFGDAAPIMIHPVGGLKSMGATERAKILAPLLTEVVASARLHGYDEKLVQGMLTLGVELWLVEDPSTGQKLFIDRAEYGMLFDGEPPTSRPRLVGVAGSGEGGAVTDGGRDGGKTRAAGPGSVSDPVSDLRPASPAISEKTVSDVNFRLAGTESKRPIFTSADKGRLKLIEYVSDGTGIITMSGEDMLYFQMARARVNTQEQLEAFLGSKNVAMVDLAWYERLAILMSNPWVRGVLVVMLILGLFVEFVHPGLILPGTVAGLCLVGLVLPALLTGLAGWWEIVAILGGIALIGMEIFVFPGIGIVGAVGLVMFCGGLVMTFVPTGGGMFPNSEDQTTGLLFGVAAVVLGLATTGVVMVYMSKSTRGLPVFRKLVLNNNMPDDESESVDAVMGGAGVLMATAEVGEIGVAITPLRPSGKVQLGGGEQTRVIDVVCDGGFAPSGVKVKVIEVEMMRVVVEVVA